MRPATSILAPLGVILASLALPSWAVTTWTFTSGCTTLQTTGCTGSGSGAAGITVTASAYSDTNGIDGSSSRTLETAYLGSYSGGLGVTNKDNSCANQPNPASCTQNNTSGSTYRTNYLDQQEGNDPEHSMDNNERWDSMLFNFSAAINLTSVDLGWYSNDADISVLAYTPTTGQSSTPTLVGKTYAGLLANGWSLVGNYADLQTRPNLTANLSTNLVSSYWLVMAYNSDAFSSYGCQGGAVNSAGIVGCTNGRNQGTTTPWDYVKIASLGGNKPTNGGGGPQGAPEPGTMLLFGAGLAGLAVARRRKVAG